jgi:hypothetical protein
MRGMNCDDRVNMCWVGLPGSKHAWLMSNCNVWSTMEQESCERRLLHASPESLHRTMMSQLNSAVRI